MDKAIKKEKEEQIIALVSQFCKEKINDEYEQLCIELTKKLGRKRNVPFMTGNLEIWAASIVYTIGAINFLFDKSGEPYISSNDIHDYFGTKASTVTGKSKQIRDMLKLSQFDNEFSTSRVRRSSPFSDYVMVDGFMYPVSALPEEFQEMVREARAQGGTISFSTKKSD